MKIVITRREPFEWADGINIAVMRLAETLLRQGHDVTCVSTVRSDPAVIRDAFACAAYPRFDHLLERKAAGYLLTGLAWLLRGRAVLRKYGPDVVLVQGAIPVVFPCPSIITCHDVDRRHPRWEPFRVPYKRLCYRLCTRIVATGSELRDALARELRMDARAMGVIPNPIERSRRPPLAFRDREKAVLHMGTVIYKRPLETLQAFAALGDEQALLYITGRPDAAVEAAVRALSPNVAARVRLLGVVPAEALARLLCAVRCVSVPSVYDVAVLSPSVLESMASGTPVVASGSISRDLISPGENCLLAGDQAARTAAMRQLLSDEAAWDGISRAGLETVARFSPQSVAAAYLRLAESLIGKSGRSP